MPQSSTAGGLGTRMTRLFTVRPLYKAASLFFAIVLWVVVSAEEPAEETLNARVRLVLAPGLRLADPLPTVRVRVAGRARELFKLANARPVLRRTLGPETPAVARLDLRTADVFLPAGVEASVREVQPRSITVRVLRDPGTVGTSDSIAEATPAAAIRIERPELEIDEPPPPPPAAVAPPTADSAAAPPSRS